MRRSSRPPPHGREHAWLETGGNPDARGTDLPKSRASGSRTPATGLPRPPIRQRYELSYAAHPEATQVAGGAVVCVRAVGPPEGRTTRSPHTCSAVPAVGLVHNKRERSLPSSRESESTCEGTGGASVGARRTGRRGASARHPAMRWACRRGVGAGRVRERPGRPCLPHTSLMTKLASAFCMLRRENQRTMALHAGRHHRHASGSFICRESFSVYSRGMATLATLATLGADLLKNSPLGSSLDGSLSPHLLYPFPFLFFQDSI